MITKIKSLAAACLLAAVACTAPAQAFPSHSMPYAAGYSLIVGTWQGRYGRELSISMDDVDGVPYSIHDVTNDGFTTVVRIILDDDRHTMLTFSFPNGNYNYVMMNNATTGRFADAMDFTRQSSFSH